MLSEFQVFDCELGYTGQPDKLSDMDDAAAIAEAKRSRRFTIDNSLGYAKNERYSSSEGNDENIARKFMKIIRRRSSKLSGDSKWKQPSPKTDTIAEQTEQIKAILERDTNFRARSQSESHHHYSILKKESSFGPITVLGLIEGHKSPKVLEALLNHFTCYDVVPSSSTLVTVDFKLSLLKVLEILVNHNCTEFPVWDSNKHSYVGFISLKEIAMYVFRDVESIKNRVRITLQEFLQWSINGDITKAVIEPNVSLKETCQIMLNSGRDFLYVWDCDNGNLLSAITPTSILQFLHMQFSKFGLHAIDSNDSVECLLEPVDCERFVHSQMHIGDVLTKFKNNNDVLFVFADDSYKNFFTTFSLYDLASFFVDIPLTDIPKYLTKQMWLMTDFRNKMKSTSFYLCHLQTSIVKAYECMILSKSDGIVVFNNQRVPVGFISHKNILTYFVTYENILDKSSCCEKCEIVRM